MALAVCALGLGACAPKRALVSPILYPTAWVQTAAEYEAAALQAYGTAARSLDRALADSTWTAALEQSGAYAQLPPAIIVDVDETVLDNSPFEARMAKAGLIYDDPAFDVWVRSAEADPVPGALEFLTEAARRGVTIFYISGRRQAWEAATRANLQRRGFPLDPSIDVVPAPGEQPDWTGDKTSRRAWVASQYRVLFLFGDDFNDFVNARVPLGQQAELLRQNRDRWGRVWFVIPNPIYGTWERALYDFEPDLSDLEKVRRITERLDTRE
jgi:acid phosphatase